MFYVLKQTSDGYVPVNSEGEPIGPPVKDPGDEVLTFEEAKKKTTRAPRKAAAKKKAEDA